MRLAGMLIVLALPLVAQSPHVNQSNYERLLRMILLQQNQEPDAAQIRQKALQTEFDERLQQFVDAFNDLERELNAKHTINAKKAKAASQAFHRLEKCEGWPAREKP